MTSGDLSIAHLTTVDLSLRYLLLPQLEAPLAVGIRSVGISAPGPWISDLQRRGIQHVPLPTSTRGMSLKRDLRAAWDLYRALRRLRPQVLHTHNPKPGLYGRIVGRLAGVPIVVNTVHGLYATPDDSLSKRALVYGLESLASRLSDAELVQSHEDVVLMRRLRLAPPRRIFHLGNGVDLARFDGSVAGDTRSEVREELGIGDDQVVVGMVGRLVREKGYLELFEAADLLDETFVFLCIGPEDPSKADALPAGVVAAAARRGVRFLGMRTDVERLYAGMDVFVLPSHREGFPRAAMEASAMGLPIVATDIRGCREVVDHERNGLLVQVGEPEMLAAAIKRLSDPAERMRMAKEARLVAVEKFDEREVVSKVMAAYIRLARQKGLDSLAAALAGVGEAAEIHVRKGQRRDAALLAALHARSIETGFLPELGARFLALLYRALIDDEDSVVLVAEDSTGPVGFVAGTKSTSHFYRRFVSRYGLRALLVAGLRLIRAATIRKAIESLRYGGGDDAGVAELLSMAVVPERRGIGVAGKLGAGLIESLSPGPIKVVVGAANSAARRAYRRMGFEAVGTIEIHRGHRSEVLEWSDH